MSRSLRILWSIPVMIGLALPATAGPFSFLKRNKPAPAQQRVPELVNSLKADPNEGKRAAAAEELREFDPKAFPEIVPVLIEAVQRDPKPEVRTAAVQSLGKVRPVSQEAGWVIEQALANDSSLKVRMAARTTLWQYQMAGYRSVKGDGPQLNPPGGPSLATTQEPPLAQPGPPTPAPTALRPVPSPVPGPSRITPAPGTPAGNPRPGTRPGASIPVDQGPVLMPPQ